MLAPLRLYHDQALYKEPGGGITPWHADHYYWPLSSDRMCTVWVPLQQTPLEMGPLEFASGSHRFRVFGRDMPISDESEARLQEALAQQNFEIWEGRTTSAKSVITSHGRSTMHNQTARSTRAG